VDIRTFITLEKAFTTRLFKAWKTIADPLLIGIARHCQNQQWDRARSLVNHLDMTEVGDSQREWIKHVYYSFIAFGAHRAARQDPFLPGMSGFDDLLNTVAKQTQTYLEHGGTQQMRHSILQQIARDQAASQEATKSDEIYPQSFQQVVDKADASGRFVTPFVDFSNQGSSQLQLIASLNGSRLATWGFTAEAQLRGTTRYRINPLLDGRVCPFCRLVSQKVFDVASARAKVVELLRVENPDDLKTLQPWPKVTPETMANYEQYSKEDFVNRSWNIPPFHAGCRCVLTHDEGEEVRPAKPKVNLGQPPLPIPEQRITPDTLKEIGVAATQEQVDHWNRYLQLSPVAVLAKLSGLPAQDILQGKLGKAALRFLSDGTVGINAKGVATDLKYAVSTVLDPYTGTYYLTQAEFKAGNTEAAQRFLAHLFPALADIGVSTAAHSLVVAVAQGEAEQYVQLGFLPDQDTWDQIRQAALDQWEQVSAPLRSEDRLLIQHLLESNDPASLTALVDLQLQIQGQSVGDWVLAEAQGQFSLDLGNTDTLNYLKENLA
jgi:hypothetical protein